MRTLRGDWLAVLLMAAAMFVVIGCGSDDSTPTDGDVDGDVDAVDGIDEIDTIDNVDTDEVEIDRDDTIELDELIGDNEDTVDKIDLVDNTEVDTVENPCDDNNPCTDDTMGDDGQCQHTNNTASCDDGNLCTQTDVCQDGLCIGSNSVECVAQDQCHDIGTCDPATGVCTNPAKENGTACDDENLCSQTDTCEEGFCVGSNNVVCEAIDQCHEAGACVPATDECTEPMKADDTVCDDADETTGNDVCTDGVCAGTPCECDTEDDCCDGCFARNDGGACVDDSISCTTDQCNAGVCEHVIQNTFCMVEGACFQDGTENPATSCQYCDTTFANDQWRNRTNGNACNDGNACTQADTCFNGACEGASPVVCEAPDQCHEAGVCNTESGVCDYANKADNTSCDDGDACTTTDTCQTGTCQGANPVVCDAADQCHEPGVCNSENGQCDYANKANGTACDDGNSSTGNDACSDGVCLGSGCTCSGENACCDGCFPINNGGACADDGINCTSDVCENGTCGHPVANNFCYIEEVCFNDGVANPDNECQYCDSVFNGEAWRNKADNTGCDDENACTQTDTCQAGTCTGSNAVQCAVPAVCKESGVCDTETGQCTYADSDNGTPCDDSNACTQTDTCFNGSCEGSEEIVCQAMDSCHLAGVCEPASGTCTNPVVDDGTLCDDTDVCTMNDTCASGVCTGDPKDADDDGYVDIACPAGDDCNDDNDQVYPGAEEVCDNEDNNCDGAEDEGCVYCTDDNHAPESYAGNLFSGYLAAVDSVQVNYYRVTTHGFNLMHVDAVFLTNGTGTGTFKAVVYADNEGVPGDIIAESASKTPTAEFPNFERFTLTEAVSLRNNEHYWAGVVYETDQTNADNYMIMAIDRGRGESWQNGIMYEPAQSQWSGTDASFFMQPAGCSEGADIRYVSTDGDDNLTVLGFGDLTITLTNIGLADSDALTVSIDPRETGILVTPASVDYSAITMGTEVSGNSTFNLDFGGTTAGNRILGLTITDGVHTWVDSFAIYVNDTGCAGTGSDPTGSFVNNNINVAGVYGFAPGTMVANLYPLENDFTLHSVEAAFFQAGAPANTDFTIRVHTIGNGIPGEVLWSSGVVAVSSTYPDNQVFVLDTPLSFSADDVFWISVEIVGDQSSDTDWILPLFDDALSPSLAYSFVSPDGITWGEPWTGENTTPMAWIFPKGCE